MNKVSFTTENQLRGSGIYYCSVENFNTYITNFKSGNNLKLCLTILKKLSEFSAGIIISHLKKV